MNQRQCLAGSFGDFRLGEPGDPQAIGDVLLHRHVREQAITLEHHVGRAPFRAERRHILAGNLDCSGSRLDKAANHSQECCLAATRRPKDREEIAALDLEIDRLDSNRPAEGLGDVAQPEKRVRVPGHHIHFLCFGAES